MISYDWSVPRTSEIPPIDCLRYRDLIPLRFKPLNLGFDAPIELCEGSKLSLINEWFDGDVNIKFCEVYFDSAWVLKCLCLKLLNGMLTFRIPSSIRSCLTNCLTFFITPLISGSIWDEICLTVSSAVFLDGLADRYGFLMLNDWFWSTVRSKYLIFPEWYVVPPSSSCS